MTVVFIRYQLRSIIPISQADKLTFMTNEFRNDIKAEHQDTDIELKNIFNLF